MRTHLNHVTLTFLFSFFFPKALNVQAQQSYDVPQVMSMTGSRKKRQRGSRKSERMCFVAVDLLRPAAS